VATPAEATELFDIITYEKGCAVLRMAESFLGETDFRAGIRAYIARFAGANAAGADLWESLAAASQLTQPRHVGLGPRTRVRQPVPVGPLMTSWIGQPGFPVLSAESERRDGRTLLHLAQRRCFAGEAEMRRPDEAVWQIPIVVSFGSEARAGARGDAAPSRATRRFLLTAREQTVELPAGARWVFANADGAGFYRLHPAAPDLAAVRAHVAELTPAERKVLLDDQWALVRNGLSDVASFAEVLVALRRDDDYLVVRAMAARLSYLHQRLVRAEDRPALAGFARWLFGGQLARLGWAAAPGESPEQAVRRSSVVHLLGEVGRDPAVLAEAVLLAAAERRDPAAVE